jgi:hypothetical protein
MYRIMVHVILIGVSEPTIGSLIFWALEFKQTQTTAN